MMILFSSCDSVNLDYGKASCGNTIAQTDSVTITPQNFPYDPEYRSFGDYAEVGFKLSANGFCAKEPINAGFRLDLSADTSLIFISAQVVTEEDTLEIPINWESINGIDRYHGSLDSSFQARNPAEYFDVRIGMLFPDKGSYYANTAYIKRLLVKAAISAAYQKREE